MNIGEIRDKNNFKLQIEEDYLVVVLGGPAMLIGLGGGAASSVSSGESDEDLDFASVQRDNAEMERRCQEVINKCSAQENTGIKDVNEDFDQALGSLGIPTGPYLVLPFFGPATTRLQAG